MLALILPSSSPTAMMTTPETTAGNSFRVQLISEATTVSQKPAKMVIPQTAAMPKDEATARLEGR